MISSNWKGKGVSIYIMVSSMPSIVLLFRNKFNNSNNTGAGMLGSILSYDAYLILNTSFWNESAKNLPYI